MRAAVGLALLALLFALLSTPVAAAELAPGGVLDEKNWAEAKGLLPEEFLETYRRGDFRHEIGQWTPERLDADPIFAAALEKNRGRYDLDDKGSIVERATGKPPEPIFAWPDLLWVRRDGLDRQIKVDAFQKYYDGQHPKFREPGERADMLSQSFSEVLFPGDVAGILSLSWRYRGADQRDSVWSYVPSLRRVPRALSPRQARSIR